MAGADDIPAPAIARGGGLCYNTKWFGMRSALPDNNQERRYRNENLSEAAPYRSDRGPDSRVHTIRNAHRRLRRPLQYRPDRRARGDRRAGWRSADCGAGQDRAYGRTDGAGHRRRGGVLRERPQLRREQPADLQTDGKLHLLSL